MNPLMLSESIDYKLPEEKEKSGYVEKKFDEIAKKYDLFNDLITFGMHRYWKKFVAKKTGLAPGEKCLDLCTGTGDIGRAVLKYQPQASVTALDFSSEMLALARENQKKSSKSKNPKMPCFFPVFPWIFASSLAPKGQDLLLLHL